MSFGKLRSPRMNDTEPKVDGPTPTPSLGNGSGSHTSLASRRQLLTTPTKNTPRSRSLSASGKNSGSCTNLSTTASKSGVASKIPVQNKATNASAQDKLPVPKRSPSVGDRSKTKTRSRMPSPVPGVKSSVTTVTTKAPAALKLPRASTPNAASAYRSTARAPSAPGTPRTRSPLRSPGGSNQAGQGRKPATVPPKGKPLSGSKKELSKLSSEASTVTNTTTASSQKNVHEDEEIIKDINLSYCQERKPNEKIPHPQEVKLDMQMVNALLNVISEECFSLCSEFSEQKNSILTNLIEIGVNLPDDLILNEKLANYLSGGDGMYQRYQLLKQSQNDISRKLCGLVSDLNSETIALRSLSTDLENKLDLLEAENDHISKQMKTLSEDLESEKEKMSSMNQRKTLLEQQIKKHSQRIKELESKSSTSDGKIYHQNSQLKSLETQMKLKDEKYLALEQKLSHQAKQCRLATEVREKLEKQRESLEARVSDLKKLKAEQQSDSAKVEENLREELSEAHRMLEKEKQLREDLEKELKNTHSRLVTLQEKSLQLVDMTEVSKATIIQEGSLKTSEKEAQLTMDLNEIQQQLDKANEEIGNYKQENEELRTAVFKATESINKDATDTEVASIINVLQSEVSSKDETIRNLQQQMDAHLKETEARGQNMKELEQKWIDDKVVGNSEDQEVLWQEILELRHRLAQAEKDNKKYMQQLTQKQLEVEQRARVMQEQAKVLQVRDELLKLLRKKDKAKTGQMTALQAKLEDQERNADTVSKFFSAKAEQLQEIYSTLEMKQRRVMQLEDEVKQLEAQCERGQFQRTRLEARIAELELAVHEKGRTPCESSIYNPRCKPSTFSPPQNRSYYTHALHREPQGESDLPLNHQLKYPLQFLMNRPRYSNRLSHPNRKRYLRPNDKTRSVLQLYRIHSSHWGDSSYSRTTVAAPRCWPSAMQYNEVKKPYGSKNSMGSKFRIM